MRNDSLTKALADFIDTITTGLRIAGIIALIILGLFVISVYQDGNGKDSYNPSADVLKAMHNGYYCRAEIHKDWPKHHQYEWICRKGVK